MICQENHLLPECSCPWVTEMVESEPAGKGHYCIERRFAGIIEISMVRTLHDVSCPRQAASMNQIEDLFGNQNI